MPRRKKQPKSHLLDLADFRASLWKTLAVNAKTTGQQIVRALRVISDDVYHAGIDAAYTTTKVRDARNVADAWDLTWLTALNIKLLHVQKSASRRKHDRDNWRSTQLSGLPRTARKQPFKPQARYARSPAARRAAPG
jgi:hypothetical protein